MSEKKQKKRGSDETRFVVWDATLGQGSEPAPVTQRAKYLRHFLVCPLVEVRLRLYGFLGGHRRARIREAGVVMR